MPHTLKREEKNIKRNNIEMLIYQNTESSTYARTLMSTLPMIHVHLVTQSKGPRYNRLDSLVVECWLRMREVPGSIPSQGPRHTNDVIKMVAVVPLFSTQHQKGKY